MVLRDPEALKAAIGMSPIPKSSDHKYFEMGLQTRLETVLWLVTTVRRHLNSRSTPKGYFLIWSEPFKVIKSNVHFA